MISYFWRPEVPNQYHWLKNQSLGQAMLLWRLLPLLVSEGCSLGLWFHHSSLCLHGRTAFPIFVSVCVYVVYCHALNAGGILVPQPGIEPVPPAVDS